MAKIDKRAELNQLIDSLELPKEQSDNLHMLIAAVRIGDMHRGEGKGDHYLHSKANKIAVNLEKKFGREIDYIEELGW